MDFLGGRFDALHLHELLVVLEGHKLFPLPESQGRVDKNTVVRQQQLWLLGEGGVEPEFTVLNRAPSVEGPTFVFLNFVVNRQFLRVSDVTVTCEQIFVYSVDSVHPLVDKPESDVFVVREGNPDGHSDSEADQEIDDDVLVAEVLYLFTHNFIF